MDTEGLTSATDLPVSFAVALIFLAASLFFLASDTIVKQVCCEQLSRSSPVYRRTGNKWLSRRHLGRENQAAVVAVIVML